MVIRFPHNGFVSVLTACLGPLLTVPAVSRAECLAEISRASQAPVIDGEQESIWTTALPLHLNNPIELYDMLDPEDPAPSPEDLSARAQFLWDEDNLYVLVTVVDENPQAPYTGVWFREDVVEFYFDLDRSGADGDGSYDGMNDWELGFFPMADPVHWATGPNSVEAGDDFTAEATETASGYRLELALPWAALGFVGTPQPGHILGLDIHIVDNDNQDGVREHKLAWHGTKDEAWRDTRQLAPVRLAGEPESVEDPVPEPAPGAQIGVSAVPVASIPDSPATGNAPRLNMLKEAPDGSGRLFVIDQLGYLYHFLPGQEPVLYLDLRELPGFPFLYSNTQNGSTSFAFHPEFARNGRLYIVSSTPAGTAIPDFPAKRPIDPSPDNTDPRQPLFHDVLLELTAEDPEAERFSGTWREVLRVEQPYGDHNLGEVSVNPVARPGHPDYGLLYLAVADGGNQFPIADADPENTAQDLATLHGSIIRINPLGANAANGQYGIPPDNPFAGGGNGRALEEIWSYGHRNPHRLSWDTAGNGTLYAFEIGQGSIEEVNRIVAGGNFGWGTREGTFLLNEFVESDLRPVPDCEPEGIYQYPVFQYDHIGTSGAIAGGIPYRGVGIPSLYGRMLIADFTGNHATLYGELADTTTLAHATSAPLYTLAVYDSSGSAVGLSTALLGPSGTRRTDVRLSMDNSGEIYLTNKRNGLVHKLESAPQEDAVPWPAAFPHASMTADPVLKDTPLGTANIHFWPWLYTATGLWAWIHPLPATRTGGSWYYFARPEGKPAS